MIMIIIIIIITKCEINDSIFQKSSGSAIRKAPEVDRKRSTCYDYITHLHCLCTTGTSGDVS